MARDITHGVIRPGAKEVARTAERLGDDEHTARVQTATQKLAEQVCAFETLQLFEQCLSAAGLCLSGCSSQKVIALALASCTCRN